jgi:hypothetical protein
MGTANYGMVSQKGMNDFASNNGSASGPYGNAAFGQTTDHNMYGSSVYGSGNGNGPYGQSMATGQEGPMGMQAYNQMTGYVVLYGQFRTP